MTGIGQKQTQADQGWIRWIKRHWKGEISFPWSFWGVGIVGELIIVALSEVEDYLFVSHNPYISLLELFTRVIGSTAILVWWGVGTWRSATKWNHQKDKLHILSYAAKLFLGLLFLSTIYTIAIYVGPQVRATFSYIADDPEWGVRGVRIVRANEIEVYGMLSQSVPEDLERELVLNPRTSVINFDSKGGRLGPAIKIRDIIKTHHLDTSVTNECSSACSIAFLGGNHRWMAKGTRMGFHSFGLEGGSDLTAGDQEEVRTAMATSGVSQNFIDKVFATPLSSLWYPTVDELLKAGVITGELKDSDANYPR